MYVYIYVYIYHIIYMHISTAAGLDNSKPLLLTLVSKETYSSVKRDLL